MANAEYRSRTNYFRVRNLKEFTDDLERYGIDYGNWGSQSDVIIDNSPHNKPANAIALFTYDFWPMFDEEMVADRLELNDGEPVPQEYESIEDLITAHLEETDVAIIMGIGMEKMRYLDGYAVAVNATGQKRALRLDDIYDLAKEIAPQKNTVTQALY